MKRFLDTLPPQVKRIECGARDRWAALLVDRRFEELDLRRITDRSRSRRGAGSAARVEPKRPRRLGSIKRSRRARAAEYAAIVGSRDDAARSARGHRSGSCLLRRTAEQLQRRAAVITAKAQLRRSVPRRMASHVPRWAWSSTRGDQLVRHGEGHWTRESRRRGLRRSLVVDSERAIRSTACLSRAVGFDAGRLSRTARVSTPWI